MPFRNSLQRWSFPSGLFTSQWEVPVLVATGRALFFSLVFLISVEKGKQRYNKATKGNQQADYPYKYQNDIRSGHWRHLPSYVIRQAGHWPGRLPPLSWVPYWNTTTVRQEFQSYSLFVEYVESGSKSISKQSHGWKRKTGKHWFYALSSPNVRYLGSIISAGIPDLSNSFLTVIV